MKYSKQIQLGAIAIVLAVSMSACITPGTGVATKAAPPKLVKMNGKKTSTSQTDKALAAEEKAKTAVDIKKSNEPDLTSLFDPLYKLVIQKSDLKNVSGTDVVKIQTLLNKIGYNVGKADGKAGKNTLAGITGFLQDFELPLDPRPTGLLVKQLTAVLDTTKGPSIVSKINGVQGLLAKLGYTVGASGIADAVTRKAITDYQLKNDLVVDGRITNQLLSALKIKK